MNTLLINPELLKIARHFNAQRMSAKAAFVDPATAAGGGAPPMDPAMMGGGGAPPMDPAMMGGGMPPMDPAMMGGAPPAPPAADPAAIGAMIDQKIQQAMAASGGGAAGAGAATIKPKIDVNVEIMQMKKMLARISDALGIQMSAAELTATPEDLTAMANQTAAGGGASPQQPQSAIQPIQPVAPAFPQPAAGGGGEKTSEVAQVGRGYSSTVELSNKASALARLMRGKNDR